jgi:transcriptional regulator with GAF, ATPase, and Fis domain/serine/threonine protein kinase/tetratricopeptide (TPR) repeat protein
MFHLWSLLAFETGQLLGRRYEVVRRLGEGGLGTAFEVLDRATKEPRCLKVVARKDPSAVLALRQEFEALRGLLHPNLVELHDFGVLRPAADATASSALPYLTTAVVRGEPLTAALMQASPARAHRGFVDALRGLAFLHGMGLLHGDLKGDNVVVDEARGVLLDLSCATRLGAGATGISGTPGRIAPELLRGERVDVRADLYAVGVLLRELTRTHSPWGDVSGLCARLTADDPGQRPPSVDAVLDSLGEESSGVQPRSVEAPRLLGRDALLAEIVATLKGREAGSVVVVRGGPGAGKTRLLTELRWTLSPEVDVVEGFPSRPDPIVSWLSRASGVAPRDDVSFVVESARALESGAAQILVLDDADSLSSTDESLLAALARSLGGATSLIVAVERDPAWLSGVPHRSFELSSLGVDAVATWIASTGRDPGLAEDLLDRVGGFPGDLYQALVALQRGATLDELALLVASTATGAGDRASALPAPHARSLACLGLSVDPLSSAALEQLGAASPAAIGARKRTDGSWALPRPLSVAELEARVGSTVFARAAKSLARRALSRARSGAHLERSRQLAEVCLQLARSLHPKLARAVFDAAANERTESPRPWATLAKPITAALPEVALELGSLALAAGEPAKAVEILERAPASDEATSLIAEAWFESGSPERAAEVLRASASTLSEPTPSEPAPSEPASSELVGSGLVDARRALLLGRIAARAGRYEEAAREADRGLGCAPTPELRADLLECAGAAALFLGDFPRAERHLADARALQTHSPKKQLRAVSYQAILAYRRGDTRAALDHYRTAQSLAETHGIVDQQARTSLNLATALHQHARYAECLALYERGERFARALGQMDLLLVFSCNLAKLYVELVDLERAEGRAKHLARDAEAKGSDFFVAAADTILAEVAEARGVLAESATLHERARRCFERLGATREMLEEKAELARLACARGLVGDARALVTELGLHPELPADVAVKVGLVEVDLAVSGNDDARALERLQRLATRAERLEQPAILAAIEERHVTIARRAGLASEAEEAERRLVELYSEMVRGLSPPLREAFFRKPSRRAIATSLSADPPRAASEAATPVGPAMNADERLATTERLLAAFRRLNSTLEPDALVAFAVDEAIAITGSERGFLLLLDDDGSSYRVALARNMDREGLTSGSEHVSRTIADEVIRSESPVVTLDALADGRFAGHGSIHALKLRSVLAVPVRSPDRVEGALYLDTRYAKAHFRAEHVDLLLAFGDQVALALRNARQTERLRRHADELGAAKARIEALAAEQAIEIQRLSEEVRKRRGADEYRHDFSEIVGRSAPLRKVLATLDRVIDSPLPILVGGESGTGKELVARAIHFGSRGRERPFVGINCGALPATVLESELFGHVRGAFTGADRDRPGLVVAAEGGTLFLDELGEMPLELQVKLLRVLQEREVRPLGSERSVPVDFRLVCATNRDLQDEIAKGRFREDLFYRVGVVSVVLPPLRERRDDLPELSAHFVERAARELGRPTPRLRVEVLRRLAEHPWPGNLRELQNVLTRATVLCDGDVIRLEDVELPRDEPRPERPGSRRAYRRGPSSEEEAQLKDALARAHGNIVRAAELAGMSRATFYRRMRVYGLDR